MASREAQAPLAPGGPPDLASLPGSSGITRTRCSLTNSTWETMSLLRKCHPCFFLSFLRKQESSEVKGFWTPASAGVTAFL